MSTNGVTVVLQFSLDDGKTVDDVTPASLELFMSKTLGVNVASISAEVSTEPFERNAEFEAVSAERRHLLFDVEADVFVKFNIRTTEQQKVMQELKKLYGLLNPESETYAKGGGVRKAVRKQLSGYGIPFDESKPLILANLDFWRTLVAPEDGGPSCGNAKPTDTPQPGSYLIENVGDWYDEDPGDVLFRLYDPDMYHSAHVIGMKFFFIMTLDDFVTRDLWPDDAANALAVIDMSNGPGFLQPTILTTQINGGEKYKGNTNPTIWEPSYGYMDVFQGLLYFKKLVNGEAQLWRTDGTVANYFYTFNSGMSDISGGLVAGCERLWITERATGDSKPSLWWTDGTITEMIPGDNYRGSSGFFAGSTLIAGVNGGEETLLFDGIAKDNKEDYDYDTEVLMLNADGEVELVFEGDLGGPGTGGSENDYGSFPVGFYTSPDGTKAVFSYQEAWNNIDFGIYDGVTKSVTKVPITTADGSTEFCCTQEWFAWEDDDNVLYYVTVTRRLNLNEVEIVRYTLSTGAKSLVASYVSCQFESYVMPALSSDKATLYHDSAKTTSKDDGCELVSTDVASGTTTLVNVATDGSIVLPGTAPNPSGTVLNPTDIFWVDAINAVALVEDTNTGRRVPRIIVLEKGK